MIYTKYKHLYKCIIIVCSFSLYGQSVQEINKLKQEYDKFKKGKLALPDISNSNDIQSTTGTPQRNDIIPYNINDFSNFSDSLKHSRKHFGYNFFNRTDTLSIWENLPVPSDYILGPGDELIISLWGATQLRQEYIISRDGKIYDEKVGMLFISGKSIDTAKKYLINQFGRLYATLNNSNPTTYLDLSLGKLRSINVSFVGEMSYPGLYPLHPFSNLITGLIQAGGVDTTGSLRSVKIIRNNQEHSSTDLYDYLLNGNLPKDIQLKDKDIIFVPVRMSSIVLCSAVVRDGIYEGKPNETIRDMIDYSGGLKPNASSMIGISRITPMKERKNKSFKNENFYIDYFDTKSFNIENGDTITVKKIVTFTNKVEIIGQVKRPGVYYFKEGMQLKDLIALGGGLHDTTYWKTIHHNQAEIIRRNPKSPYHEVITFDIKNIFNDKVSKIPLQNLDKIVIHANPNFFEKNNIYMIGEIKIPGLYPITKDGETLNSFLNRSGGLTNKALDDGISIYRNKKYFEQGIKIKENYEFLDQRSNSEKNSSDNYDKMLKNNFIEKIEREKKEKWVKVAWKNKEIPLMPGDSVVIRESTGTVNVSGEVYNPGLIEYEKGKNLKYYINAAGGPTINGTSRNAIIIYANGLVVPKKSFNNPIVKDGATIVVNKKEYKDPFNITQFTSSLLSIVSTTVTILVLSQQLSS